MLFNVKTDRCAAAASTGESNDDTTAVIKLDIYSLLVANTAIEIGVREIIGFKNLATLNARSNEFRLLCCDELIQVCNHFVGTLGVAAFVIIAREECAAVDFPEVHLNGANRWRGFGLLSNSSDDVEPSNHCPETVLFTDVVATGTETLLSADIHLISIKESTEELPSSGDFIALKTLLLGYKIDST